ncbi:MULTISPECIES: Lrp/AsnC family transcriptional regulator [unclassified Ruegeria]|uniref:Lrp/AsnC family transcriptional regulator n=1 Tax=unclassified Ruegeria TaxID=2625375 RepID=UPI001489F5D9|nr:MULTISPECIES: Lrp/AsnC family transcriptional regulator [unclassified Ruegeria]NOD76924.1 AsnC family transcriptional regulator [Ruegeria sp. HKCCD4332]NOD88447.1 AsnC family transcriptional regulator [Ruegeria sp. HKCCD4318]NOD94730.1 AsnC family transcriptional regulator [Ruegeria sp. HKCCD4884]NOE13356.1 AsnC family transcriptional regulator [Ruegeria sp. HKCCD4318-2]NOG11102.1 Lrp/AsnC family transcriptional regulator [Ruegeria sp. HKCCD4315]
MTLDDKDRAILNRMQDDLPLTSHPFAAVADELGLSETELLERLTRLKKDRVITRFGPFFDAAAMGGAFCLCAMAVPTENFETVLTKVNAHPEVAHNYERTHRLNMWFVLATETPEGIEAAADAIERETGIDVLRFPKLQEFFIGFRVAA